jgi:hypothetical protein
VLRRRFLPRWLVRGLQAGLLGAVLSGGTLLAFQLSRPAPRLALPQGIDGVLILVPALLALAVLAVSMPVFMAATRSEALLGSVAGFLVAADLLMAVSFVARQSITVHVLFSSLPLGVVAALLSVPAALLAIVAGPVASELGFGHSAGLRAVVVGAIVTIPLAIAGPFVA